jgi:hypothetical protein
VSLLFPALAIPIVAPAAFLLGVVGWRLSSPTTAVSGLVVGGAGAIGTYLVSLLVVGSVLTAEVVLSPGGGTLVDAAETSVGIVVLAFLLTWWITVPVGCLSGFVYVNVTENAT